MKKFSDFKADYDPLDYDKYFDSETDFLSELAELVIQGRKINQEPTLESAPFHMTKLVTAALLNDEGETVFEIPIECPPTLMTGDTLELTIKVMMR